MLSSFPEGFCPAIQRLLNDIMGKNSPQNLNKKPGYIQALISDYNRQNITQTQLTYGTAGKTQDIQLRYTTPFLDTDVQDGWTECIPAGAQKEPVVASSAITEFSQLPIEFSMDKMRSLCEGKDTWIAEQVQSAMNTIISHINVAALTKQALNFGTYVGGALTNTYNIIAATVPPTPNTYEMTNWLLEYEATDRTGTPMIVGGNIMYQYAKMVNAGCCNGGGYDVSQFANDYLFYYDKDITTVFAPDNNALMLAPQAVQFLEWYQFPAGSPYEMMNDMFEYRTITDPNTGLLFDISITFDPTCKLWTINVSKAWDLFFQPTDAFEALDPLFGTRGTLPALLT